ncbi:MULTISPECIES: Flp family type IVb pilin [unclassified Sphingomonas]|uniref:Flp family type IVb pilin n=1 Tax=unclassified Sphingomonas TaxID=196159 RepID=UPI000BD3D518|nr:MAG: pilus assembly protein [Sphingomonas sp. 12-62-6]OYX40544.1 MAG: pilus assembly protein [Sphingomonas sp. 32-62-10]OYY66954.1 MAG: pilus assembly protein [Sphingomonas sp. 28-62-11]
MLKLLRRLAKDRKGGTAIEYGLIASVIVVTLIASFIQLANTTTGIWSNVNTKMDDARNGR